MSFQQYLNVTFSLMFIKVWLLSVSIGCVRFDGVTKNFKLYYDNQHYVGEKRFDTIQDLVADGLITFYLESKAADYIASLSSQSNYAESPYVAYNTQKRFQMAAASGPRRAGKPGNDAAANQRPASTAAAEDGAAARGGRAANIPVERTRLSQIAEARRSQESAMGRPASQAGQMSPPQAAASPAATPGGKPPPARQSVPAANQRSSPSTRPSTSSTSGQNSSDNTAVSQDVRITSSTNTDGPVRCYFCYVVSCNHLTHHPKPHLCVELAIFSQYTIITNGHTDRPKS